MEKIPVVLSCVGLLHDLGNPPFGHFGEVVIGEWLQNWMDYVRGWFMYCVAYGFSSNYENIMEGTFYQELIEGTFHEKSMQIFKGAMAKFVYGIAEIVKLESDYRNAKTGEERYDLYLRFPIVTDFISGMTDSYAKNLYQELNGY